MPQPVHDLVGRRFERLTVVRFGGFKPKPSGTRVAIWVCVCDCGREKCVMGWALKNRSTRSCGCLQRERATETHTRHGAARHLATTSEYRVWSGMLARCLTTTSAGYQEYGGRGITVCERWNRFENFLDDMGKRPPGKSIDRINNDGNYEPDNCRWATPKEQANNRRRKRTRAEMIEARKQQTPKEEASV